jgi:hypothetical protein
LPIGLGNLARRELWLANLVARRWTRHKYDSLLPNQEQSCSMTEWYFVWVEGLRGPTPQKWSSDGLWGQVGRQDVIVRFALTDQEAHLTLDELARLHPIPAGK